MFRHEVGLLGLVLLASGCGAAPAGSTTAPTPEPPGDEVATPFASPEPPSREPAAAEPSPSEPAAAAPSDGPKPIACPPRTTQQDEAAHAAILEMPMICGSEATRLIFRNVCPNEVTVKVEHVVAPTSTVELGGDRCTVLDDYGVISIRHGADRLEGCFGSWVVRVGCKGIEAIEGPVEDSDADAE